MEDDGVLTSEDVMPSSIKKMSDSSGGRNNKWQTAVTMVNSSVLPPHNQACEPFEELKDSPVDCTINRRLVRMGSGIASAFFEDMSQGKYDQWEPELCVRLLRQPTVQNYSGMKRWLEHAATDSDRLVEFLVELDGLTVLFESLERLCDRGFASFADAVTQLECVACIKQVLNSKAGLEYIVENRECIRKLARALETKNTLVKKQLFELMSAVSISSDKGHAASLEALTAYKTSKNLRYRFSVIVDELRKTEVVPYKATLLAFINCIVAFSDDLRTRIRLRNEFFGLGLLELINDLRDVDDSNLHVQCDAFDHGKLSDEEEAECEDPNTKSDVHVLFEDMLSLVCCTPNEYLLINILRNLVDLCRKDPNLCDELMSMIDVNVEAATLDAHSRVIRNRLFGVRNAVLTQKDEATQTARFNKISYVNKRQLNKSCDISIINHDNERNNELESKVTGPSMTLLIPSEALISSVLVSSSVLSPFPGEDISNDNVKCSRPPPPPPSLPATMPRNTYIPAPPHPPMPGNASCILPPPPVPPVKPGGFSIIPPPPPPLQVPGNVSCIPPPPPPLPPMPGNVSFVPPPPPPPPLLGSSSGMPPPPPPPTSTLVGRLNEIVRQPERKMKTLSWSKLSPQAIEFTSNSVWGSLKKRKDKDPHRLNLEELEQLFSRTEISPTLASKPSRKLKTEISFLESKRSLGVNIFLAQFKDVLHMISKISDCDSAYFGLDRLLRLEKLLPEKAELASIDAYDGDPNMLGPAERFYLNLAKVEGYVIRLQGMLLEAELPSTILELMDQLNSMTSAAEAILKSERFADFLALVLDTGNFLNAGSYAGTAAGFKLNTLARLRDTKSNRRGVTLLHYLVETAEKQDPEMLNFVSVEIADLNRASRFSLEESMDEVMKLERRFNTFDIQLKTCSLEIRDKFASFLKTSKNSLKRIQNELERAKDAGKRLALYFCEDLNEFKLKECFVQLVFFGQKIVEAKRENEQRLRLEAKSKLVKNCKVNTRGKRQSQTLTDGGRNDGGECLIDKLLGEIKRGSFKLRKMGHGI